jgi:hypothetical protein
MRSAAVCAVLLALASTPAMAASASNGAAVLRLPLSARAAALGGALAAVGGGLDSLGVNPAGASAAKRPEMLTTFFTGAADDSFGFLGYEHPLKAGTPLLGFAYYEAGSVDVADLNGSRRTVAAERDYVGMAGWAMPLGGGVSVGALGKAYKFTLGQSASASGFAGDAGARWETPLNGFSLGAAVQNLGPDVKYEAAGDPLPLTARAGAAWSLEMHPQLEDRASFSGMTLTLTADAVRVRDEATTGAAGGEFSLSFGPQASVGVRLGNQFNSASDGGLSFGVGVREGPFNGDYALTSRGALGNVQTFSLGVRF